MQRRIFLGITGLSPQVVTEAVYALACVPEGPWIPHEVHLITTRTGAENARLNLLHPNGWFHRLIKDYGLPDIAFPTEHIHIIQDEAGQPLDDIRSPKQNTASADFITDRIRQLTKDDESELHVSMAGGRKTMGYYAGYALSLYGRAQDRLSHVLVSDPYENNREFYYPTPYDHAVHVQQGSRELTVDARHARVDLADIPFVRLRDGLPQRLLQGQAAFSRVIETANRSLQGAYLQLDVPARSVIADGEVVGLSEPQFLVLLWLAARSKAGEGAVDWGSDEGVASYLSCVRKAVGSMSSTYDRIESTLRSYRGIAIRLAKYFEPQKSNINAGFKQVLGQRASERYAIERESSEGVPRYGLSLAAEQIEIRWAG